MIEMELRILLVIEMELRISLVIEMELRILLVIEIELRILLVIIPFLGRQNGICCLTERRRIWN